MYIGLFTKRIDKKAIKETLRQKIERKIGGKNR